MEHIRKVTCQGAAQGAKSDLYSVSQKVYHATIDDNFNSSCPIPVMFGTNIAEC